MIRRRTEFGLFFLVVAVVLGLATAIGAFQGSPAHAQEKHNGTVSLSTDQTEVYEGAAVVVTLNRNGGPMGQAVNVRVNSWEYNRTTGFGVNPSSQDHNVTIEPGQDTATLTFTAYVDGVSEPGYDVVNISIQEVYNGYQKGSPGQVNIEINDPPSSSAIIGISSSLGTVAEGGIAVFTLHRSGDLSADVTVNLRHDDPHELLRGNHWDPPPYYTTEYTIQANDDERDLTLSIPDDQRDVDGQSFTLTVAPSDDYLLGNTGLSTDTTWEVTDNDTAQELELQFGGNGVSSFDAVNEGDQTLKFVVTRRRQDANGGQTATFVVRVETDRSGPDPLLDDWTEDVSTGRLFREYPLELAGSETKVAQDIEVIENGSEEGDWSYWASIKTLEDVDGNPITDAQEAEYWTVKQGFREATVSATDSGGVTGTVDLSTTQTEVYEGAEVLFTLTRSGGPIGEARTVEVSVREPNRSPVNPLSTGVSYYATFEPWESTATLSVVAYVDTETEEVDPDPLEASLTDAGTGYLIGTTNAVVVEINDPPNGSTIVDIPSNSEIVDEGDIATFTLTRSGDTSSNLTVTLEYQDVHELLRGNHWEPAPQLPTAVTIPAGAATLDVSVPVPDDQRDVTGNPRLFWLRVAPSDDYLLGGSGYGPVAGTKVRDNDTAQELEFFWGYFSEEDASWEPGESYITCNRSCPGPAEGIFYYEDDRYFQRAAEMEPPWPAHFQVIRRAEDVGQTATFVVRVEHNRGWESPRHAHWPIDPVTGKHYFEFPLTLTGNQRQVVGRIELLDSGLPDPRDYEYSAEIKRIEDVSNGSVLDLTTEAQYWTVNEKAYHERKNVISPARPGWPIVYFSDASPDPVMEGQEVTFTLYFQRGNALEPLEVPVRIWEPNRRGPDGSNPSEQIHTVVFPADALTADFVYLPKKTETFTVTVTDDQEYESSDFLHVELMNSAQLYPGFEDSARVGIVDDDIVGITVGPTAITAVGGRSNEYSVALDTRPSGDVTVTIDGAAGTDLIVDSSSLTFTPADWNTAQTISVTAVQNAAPGTVTLTHTVSSADDALYDAETAEDVIVTILEAPDHPLVQVGATASDQDLTVAEGGSETYSIVLSSQPAGDVTVDIGGVPGTDLSLDNTSLTFTDRDWNIPQTVTVTADQDADVVDDTITLTHTVTSVDDGYYDGLTAGNVTVTVTDDDVPAVAVNFQQGTYTVVEGATVPVTVTLSADPKRTVDVPLTTANQGGATGGDYSDVPSILTFNSGQTEQIFTFTAVQDTVDDNGESVRLGLGNTLPTGMFAGNTNESVVSITDDDGPPVTVNFEYEFYTVLEGSTVAVTVTLSADPERAVTVPLTAANRSGATSDDYSDVPADLTFNSGETEKSFTFTAIEDAVDDEGESVRLGIGRPLPAGVSAGTLDQAEVSISGERTTHIQRVNSNGTPSDNTTVAGLFTVRVHFLPSASELAVVDLEITGGTAQDILARPISSTNVWYVIALADDILPDEEAPTVTVRVPEDVVEGGNPAAEVTYDVLPSFTALLTTAATEPVTGNFNVTVTFSEDVTELPGPTESGVWYFSPSEDLVITHGTYVRHRKDTDRVWTITVRPNRSPGLTTITLPYGTVATGFDTGVWNQEASLQVQAGKRSVAFGQAAYTADEGAAVTVTVTLDADPLTTVEIPLIVTDQSGAEAGDHSGILASLTFNTGETEKTFTFSATDDSIDDDGESVKIAIGTPLPNGIKRGNTFETTVSITDYDTAGVNISETSLEIEEGTSADYRVVLTSEPVGDVTVTMEGAAGTDLSLDNATLTFTPLDWSIPQTVTVTANHDDDAVAEPVATITHKPSSAADSIYEGLGVGGVEVIVVEDDSVGVTFNPKTPRVPEGGSRRYTWVLDSQPTDDVVVTIKSLGSVARVTVTPQNWSSPDARVVFAPNDTDTIDNSYFIAYSLSGGDYDRVDVNNFIYISVDDDPVMRYSLSEVAPVEEDAGTVRLEIQAVTNEDGEPRIDYRLTLAALEDTAEADRDFEGVQEVLNFAVDDFVEFVNDNGQTRYRQTVYFDFVIHDDLSAEEEESFLLRLWSAKGYKWPAYGVRERRVTIIDNDSAGVTVNPTELTIEEGNSDTYDVVLNTEPAGDVTVTIGGATGTDLSLDKDTLTFTDQDWDQPQTVTVTADHDSDAVDEAQVTLTHTASSLDDGAYDGLDADDVTVTVTDDDPQMDYSLVDAGPFDEDAGTVRVEVVAVTNEDGAPSIDYAVAVQSEDVTTNSGGDYEEVDETLVFAVADFAAFTDGAGETRYRQSVYFDLVIFDNFYDEDAETFLLKLSESPGYEGSVFGVAQTEVTINDNDTAGVTISETSLDIREGVTATYRVVLDSTPTWRNATVTINDPANPEITAEPDSLIFNERNWDVPRIVTVTAGHDSDGIDEDATSITHTVTSDFAQYDGLDADDVTVTVTDDDPQMDYSLVEAEPVDEDAGTVQVEVVAVTNEDGAPSIDYAVAVQSEDVTARSPGDYEEVDETLVFAVADFAAFTDGAGETRYRQSVYFDLVIVDNFYDEDAETFLLKLSESPGYEGSVFGVPQTEVTITDDDEPGVSISKTSLDIEEGDSDTYEVELDTEPAGNVMVTIGGTIGTDLSLDKDTLTFTEQNWDQPQTVTVTADHDGDAVNEPQVTITHTASSDDDTTYDDLRAGSITVTITDDDEPGVSISKASLDIEEGDSDTYEVKLDTEPAGNVMVTIGGTIGTDLSLDKDTLTFTEQNWDQPQTVTVTADHDGDAVNEPQVTITHTASSDDDTTYDDLRAGSITVTITDDDEPGVSISKASLDIEEGDSDTYEVKLDTEPAGNVMVTIGGTIGTDLSLDKDTLTFTEQNWDQPQTVTVTADHDDDAVNEDPVTLTHTVTTQEGSDYDGVRAADVAATITDDDDPRVKVSYEKSSYTVDEGSSVTVTVKLDAAPERQVIIPIETEDLGGASNADYSGVPASVTFGPTDIENEITFTAATDSVDDDEESVKLTFGSTLPDRVSAGSISETTVSITDDDVPSVEVSFEQNSYTVAEGSTVTVKVKLSAEPERTVDITLVPANQGDTSDADYSLSATSLTFNSGDTEKSFTFTATDDSDNDDGESVKLTFVNLPAGVSVGTPAETTVSITDDDVPAVAVSFQQNSYNVAEGSTVTVKVRLSAEPERTVDITLVPANQGDTSDADYSLSATSLTFNSGDTEKSFTFEAADDAEDDDGETVKLTFVDLPAGVSVGTPAETTVSITDDDVPSVEVSFEQNSYTVAEGSGVTVKVKLNAEPERPVDITLVPANQGGAGNADYSLSATSLTFSPADTSKSFTFTATDDSDNDDGETVKLTFVNLPAGVSVGTPAETTVSITDDDVPSVEVSFQQNSYTVAEGSGVTVKVKLNAEPERPVDITLVPANQGGAGNADYSLSATSLTFNSGDTEKSFTFTATDDSDNDDGESVKLTFVNLPAGVSVGTPAQTTVSITDDDLPSVEVSFEQNSYTVAEGSGVTVKVKLNAEPERPVDITLVPANQGGAGNADYSLSATSLTFNSGDTEKSFTFTANQDSVDDDGESVELGFGRPLPAGVSEGSVPKTVVSIRDDDAPSSLTVNFKESGYTVTEGGTVEVVLTLDDDPERRVIIPLSWSNEDGASDSDHTGVPTDVTFNSGETEKSFEFSAASDRIGDPGEKVSIKLENLPPGTTAGTTGETEVTIGDVAPQGSTTVRFGLESYGLSEGSSTNITVVMSPAPGSDAIIQIATEGRNGATPADYSVVPASLTFGPTDTEKSFTFTATDDAEDDDGESVKLTFVDLPDGVSVGTPAETTVSITDDDVPSVEVSFEQNSYTVAEGSGVTVKVRLSAEPERTVDITLVPANQGGAGNADYSLSATSLTFNSGDTEKSFTFTATDDSDNDDGESVKLTFVNLPAGVSVGTPAETTVSITDDDLPSVEVSFEQNSYTVAEGSGVTVKVKLNAEPERTVDITLVPANQGDTSDADYSLSATSLTFNSGDTEKSFTFTATDDSDNDDGETVKLTFVNLPAGVSVGTPAETTVSITDDDVPSVEVSFQQNSYNVAEGSGVTVKVKLSAEPEREVIIPITKANQDGASGDDYSGVPANVTFNSGDTEVDISFAAASDNVDDDGESVKLTFGNTLPTGVTKGTPAETIVSITDDDVPSVEVSFQQNSYNVAEGSGVTVKVKLNAEPEREVIIPITKANQDGASGDDYSGVPANVTFNSGDTEVDISFAAASDNVDDDGESVKLTFGNTLPTGVTKGTPAEAIVSITDDDAPSSLTVNFEASTYTVTEGGTEEIVLTLDDDPERKVTIPLSWTNKDGASDSDYSGVPTTVVFNSGENSKSFMFSAASDRIGDPDEKVIIDLVTLPSGITAGTTGETEVTIENVEPQGSTTVSFGLESYGLSEGLSTTITVVMNPAPGSDAIIQIDTEGRNGATPADYSVVPASVTFGPTDIEQTFTFTANQDTDNDDGESVKLTFVNLPAGVTVGTPAQTTVSITDDDLPSVEVSFEQNSYTVAEGSGVTVKVKLNAEPERPVDITLVPANQGDTSDADYSLSATSLTFGPADTSKTFTFEAADDAEDDDGETVKLTFVDLPAGVSVGTPAETTVSITDDDVPSVEVSFEQNSYTVAEGSGVTVKVKLNAEPERTVDITLVPANQGDTSDADYSLSATSLTFNSGDTEKSFTFTATDDSDNDDGETVKLTFVNLPAGVSVGTPAETTVSITDDDVPSVEVSFQQNSYNVAEGSGVTVKVKLSAEPEREVIIPITKANQDGASGDDYSGVPANVTFNSGDTEVDISFAAASDNVDDDGESVKLTFGNTLPTGVTKGTPAETIVSITDDDVPSVEVSFQQNSYNVAEGSGVTVKVKLNAEPEREVIIPIAKANQDGASGDDYSGVPANVTFNSGDTEVDISFAAASDNVDDDGESVKLTFGNTLPTGVTKGTPAEAIVSITDDDVPAVAVSFELASYTVAESDDASTVDKRENEVTVKVTLSAEPERTVDITLVPANQGDTSDADYSLSATSLTFGPTNTQKTFTFTANQDSVDDDGESVKLSFGSPLPEGVTVGSPAEAVVTITDDDLPAVAVSFSSPSYTVTEGEGVEVTVTLSGEPEREIIIPIKRTNQGGASDSDYRGVPDSLTFNATETSKSFTVEAVQDNLEDIGESVKLGFGSTLPAGVTAGTNHEATVSIANGIAQNSLAVNFEVSEYTLTEGDTRMVTVTLSAAPGSEVIIPLVPIGQEGASDSDYKVEPDSVTFNATDTMKSFTFTAVPDEVDDDGERVKLTFGTLPGGVSPGTTNETTMIITDGETVIEVSFEKSSYSVDEGHGVEVMVRLDPAPDHQMEIPLQKSNINGTSDTDYYGVPSMLNFERGDTEKTFTIFAELDEENDDGEAVEVTFVNLPAMVREGDPSKAMVSLRDNGGPYKDGITCIDNNRANIVTVLSERGEISSPGEVDTWVIPGVDPFRTYFVEILGADSSLDVWGQDVGGGLTLADPHPVSLNHEEEGIPGTTFNSTPGDFGTGRNSRLIFIFSTYGDFVLKVKSGESAGDQGTGSYHLLVRYDNYCVVRDDDSIVFPFEGGPEGYAQDIRDDARTRVIKDYARYSSTHQEYYFAGGHFLGDNWGSEPDEDWIRFELEEDTEYEVSLKGSDHFPVEHRLMRPRITGIYDKDSQLFHEGAAGSGTDPSVTLTFRTADSGEYYLGIGSNPGGRTGVYSYRVRWTGADGVGLAAANNSPTGGPGINSPTGVANVGEELTATTSGIADADGLEDAIFSYQWVRHDPFEYTDTDIPGATGSTYTVKQQDLGQAIKIRVEFTDDAGNDEELTGYTVFILPPVNTRAANTPAAGQPTITGTVEVGHVLTADTSGISDAGSKDKAAFEYRWIAGDSAIENATGMSHRLTEDEEGLAIRVAVTFIDGAGNRETLTSTPTGLVQPRSDRDGRSVGPGNTPPAPENLIGTANSDGSVTLSWEAPDDDSVKGYRILRRRPEEGEKTLLVHVNDTGSTATEYTDSDVTLDVLHVYGVKAINAAGLSDRSNLVNVTPGQPAEPAQNSPAQRAPVITGTAQVGETLTADTSGIADENGLENVSFSYQWLADDADIGEATGSTYTLVDTDEGNTVKVLVRFTDDAGNEETLTSDPTGPVQPHPSSPVIRGTARVGETLTVDTSGIADEDGLENVVFSYQWVAGESDITDATGSTYTLVDADEGKTVKVLVRFTDDAGNEETLTSAATDAVEAAAQPNSPATGQPAITGTAQVGETLTADTSDIADENGLENVSFSHQWIADDADISGATGSTYTLIDSDEGKTIKVRVRFTDDAGNEETLTSEATDAVEAAAQPNSPATGQPVITGTAQVGETLTADTSGIADENGLENVSFSYQWVADDADISGATGSTYTLIDSDEGKTIKVRVSFTDNGGNDETLTSEGTDAVEAAAQPNSPATGQPAITGTAQVGGTLTADTTGIADEDGLENVVFSYQWVTDDADIGEATGSTYTLVDADEGKTVKVRVSFTDNGGNDETLTSEATDAVEPLPNTPATGAPTITGTARVGETLTVDTSGISDDEGMENTVFTYRWMAGGTDIPGATGSSYTLTGDDEGKNIQVWVSFTDDGGNPEALTSAATDAVAPVPPPLTVSLRGAAPVTHDGSTEFTFEIEFSEQFLLSFKKLKLHAFDVTDGGVLKAQRVEKSSNISWRITVRPDSNADVTVVLPVTTRCGAQGAICTRDGRKLSNSLEFTVSGPGQ